MLIRIAVAVDMSRMTLIFDMSRMTLIFFQGIMDFGSSRVEGKFP
jgi:hypothetical protein